ncbi:MAG TPA: hypothetical protein VK797_15620 [Tepidisphaeraceae bacterium]|nr:hypothetical protein [Tepidisphaeraceae bacterium]
MKLAVPLVWLAIASIVMGAGPGTAPAHEPSPLFGFTAFPYDFTLEAVIKTHEIVVANSTIYALHFDDGIPWKEALADGPWPRRIQKEWDDQARGVPANHKIYLGLAPLATDRKSLAPATGEQKRLPLPAELAHAEFDDPKVETAYLNYARRAVKQFKPDFLNLGIEAGGILMRDPVRWRRFERLYEHVRSRLKQENPDLAIGISFSLGHLRVESNANIARPLIDKSDYLGLSFYPSAAAFDEKFGLPPYGQGAGAWRKPLAWVHGYTQKPIALCETGYTTRDSDLPQFDLHIKGDNRLQADYVRELFEIARRDRYAFVIWFLAIDYDRLYAKMPPGSEVMQLWRNIGLLDGDLRPKPAWAIWQEGVRTATN